MTNMFRLILHEALDDSVAFPTEQSGLLRGEHTLGEDVPVVGVKAELFGSESEFFLVICHDGQI